MRPEREGGKAGKREGGEREREGEREKEREGEREGYIYMKYVHVYVRTIYAYRSLQQLGGGGRGMFIQGYCNAGN